MAKQVEDLTRLIQEKSIDHQQNLSPGLGASTKSTFTQQGE